MPDLNVIGEPRVAKWIYVYPHPIIQEPQKLLLELNIARCAEQQFAGIVDTLPSRRIKRSQPLVSSRSLKLFNAVGDKGSVLAAT